MQHTVFITGAAGYVGFMLVDRFSKRADVDRIVALDKEEMPAEFRGNQKIIYIQKNTADAWEADVDQYGPDIVVHTAWQIRDLYGNRALQWRWNIEGSDKVFAYALTQKNVRRLVYFSTVASYGAYPSNTLEQRFTEDDAFRPSEYRYAEEKRIAESRLADAYAKSNRHDLSVSIVRPAAITGPRGRYARMRFGLQSALSGQLKGSVIYSAVTALTSFVPATKQWARQFVHEDDVTDIAELLAFDERAIGYEAYNLAPHGAPVFAEDMARAVGKRILRVSPLLIRIAFFCMWHMTLGKIPTSRGAWKGYSYPILVDGSKITRKLGYAYRMPSTDAFIYTDGRYESVVPDTQKHHFV